MSALASTIEIGAHPAIALLIGGIATTFLRGRFASFALVLAPLFGLGYMATLEVGATSNLHLFGYEIPETLDIVFLVGWVSLITGLSLGNYFAWGDKLSSSTE